MFLYKGLVNSHSDIFSAWSMILVFIYSTYKLRKNKCDRLSFAIWIALLCDIPSSILYHASIVDKKNKKRQKQFLSMDIIGMYIGHLILHIILCIKSSLPLEISVITSFVFIIVCAQIINRVSYLPYRKLQPECFKYMPLIFLHLIPITYSGCYMKSCWYIMTSLLVYIVYGNKLIEKIVKSDKYSLSNTFMHLTLLIYTKIVYEI